MMSKTVQIPSAGVDAELVVRVAVPSVAGAPVILYLHGFGSSQDGEKAEFFRARAAEAGFGFISVDLQGHGRSGGTMRGLTLTRCLRDVARVRGVVPMAAGPVAMLGSSMGAFVALWHAATTDMPVRSLALISPAIGLERTLANMLGVEGMKEWQQTGVLEVTNELGTFDLGWEFVADLAAHSRGELASRHRTPTVAFQGKLDDRVSWEEVAAFAAEASLESGPGDPKVRLELIEDGDHRLIERLDWIWTEARSFFSACNLATGTNVE